mgnify:CR=1
MRAFLCTRTLKVVSILSDLDIASASVGTVLECTLEPTNIFPTTLIELN